MIIKKRDVIIKYLHRRITEVENTDDTIEQDKVKKEIDYFEWVSENIHGDWGYNIIKKKFVFYDEIDEVMFIRRWFSKKRKRK